MKLIKLLQQNTEGVSFTGKGVNYKPVYFKTGYFVALTDNKLTRKNYQEEIKRLREIAKQLNLKTYFFGYWKDDKTGLDFLDISLHIASKAKAITIGQTFKQKAIFDCYKLESLYI